MRQRTLPQLLWRNLAPGCQHGVLSCEQVTPAHCEAREAPGGAALVQATNPIQQNVNPIV